MAKLLKKWGNVPKVCLKNLVEPFKPSGRCFSPQNIENIRGSLSFRLVYPRSIAQHETGHSGVRFRWFGGKRASVFAPIWRGNSIGATSEKYKNL
jgi:hypothetical protein